MTRRSPGPAQAAPPLARGSSPPGQGGQQRPSQWEGGVPLELAQMGWVPREDCGSPSEHSPLLQSSRQGESVGP